ncbi:MAG: carbohydrate kinase [Ignavibacteriae bacterium]|nr:carbohydrate kinase [Ignavibacteriota bacterium]
MNKNIVCFGEVLWDILPSGKVAGGAPMNVAIRLQSLGIPTKIISKIGNDSLGSELLSILKNKKVDISQIQLDKKMKTGEVLVKLDSNGIATYNIVYPSAWDKIELTEENINCVKNSDAFIFGSLICRDEVSKYSLLKLLENAKYKVFDVNLRKPFYSIPLICELMNKSDLIKMNDEELLIIAKELGSTEIKIEENIKFISHKTKTNSICITRGKDGAILFIDNKFYFHNGFKVKVEDTIGSGDSFLAALISKILISQNYEEALEFACAVGAIIASHKGANPILEIDEINKFIKSNNVKLNTKN